MNIFLVFRALLGYCIIGIVGAICAIPCLINACLPASIRYDNPVYFWFLDLFYRTGVFATFLPITVEGRENIPHEPAIIVANHQSALDIPLIGSLLNRFPHVWFFLVRYAKIPLFGFIARRLNIVVDPSGLRKMTQSIDIGLSLIANKRRHVIIFPEGGRSINGEIQKFYYGFALIAQRTRRPVIPIMMFKVGKAYPPGSFLLYPQPIRIVIGNPIFMREGESLDDFVRRVHTWFVQYNSLE
jgi:1-acyl-sn-glycerol-3-phosphate acyltransferase